MAFKMKGWSPFDKKDTIKEEKSFTDKEESYMDRVYTYVGKNMGDSSGHSVMEIANMTEKQREGNITDYEPGDFDKMVKEAKTKVKR
jgi:hypothetical protein